MSYESSTMSRYSAMQEKIEEKQTEKQKEKNERHRNRVKSLREKRKEREKEKSKREKRNDRHEKASRKRGRARTKKIRNERKEKENNEVEENEKNKQDSKKSSTYDEIMENYRQQKEDMKKDESNKPKSKTSTTYTHSKENPLSEKETEQAKKKSLKRWETQQNEIDRRLKPQFEQEKREEVRNIRQGTGLLSQIVGIFTGGLGAKATQIAGQQAERSIKNETLEEWRKNKYSSDVKVYQGGELKETIPLTDKFGVSPRYRNRDNKDNKNNKNISERERKLIEKDTKRKEGGDRFSSNGITQKEWLRRKLIVEEGMTQEEWKDYSKGKMFTQQMKDINYSKSEVQNALSSNDKVKSDIEKEDYEYNGETTNTTNPFSSQSVSASNGNESSSKGLNYAHIGLFGGLILLVYYMRKKA